MTASKPRAVLRDWLVSGRTPGVPGGAPLRQEAKRQGLLGRLAGDATFLGGLEADERAEWRAAATALLVRGTWQLDLARRVLDLLREASLRALPLKGAALAERLYGSAAERPMADVDVLVLDAPERGLAQLAAHGFVVAERADHAVALRHLGTGGVVELHRGYTSCPDLFPVDADGLWARRRGQAGLVEVVPASEDLLVSSSLHAVFQHGFGLSLVQFLDLRLLLEREPLPTAAVLTAATAARATGAVLLALRAASHVVGARPDEGLLSALEERTPAAVVRRARALTREDPLGFVAPEPSPLASWRLGLLPGRRLELLRRTLAPRPWPGEPARPAGLGAAVRRAVHLAARVWPRVRTAERVEA